MTLRQLKDSLAKVSTNFDNLEVVVQYVDSGRITFSSLVMTGYTKNLPRTVVLGTRESVEMLIKSGNIQPPKSL